MEDVAVYVNMYIKGYTTAARRRGPFHLVAKVHGRGLAGKEGGRGGRLVSPAAVDAVV